MRAAHLTTPLLAGVESTRTSLGNPGLNALGVDVFRDIVACLSGPEVAKLSCVSRGWKEACDDKRLWGYLYGRAFTTSHKPPVIGARHPKQMFQARYMRRYACTVCPHYQAELRPCLGCSCVPAGTIATSRERPTASANGGSACSDTTLRWARLGAFVVPASSRGLQLSGCRAF